MGCGSGCGTANLWLKSSGEKYSRLLTWFDGASYGIEAVGMATPPGGVPVSGSANYDGAIFGRTSESHPSGGDSDLDGNIHLSFDFGLGSLAGYLSVNVHQHPDPLGIVSFRDTVYSTGSTTFSGKFDTNLPGLNSFSGLFAGPHAEELIGNFAFPYQSPIDGKTYQADGAFVGAK